MTNLLEETIDDLKSNGKTPDDVVWVGDADNYSDWDNFAKVADFKYDSGFGDNEISKNLLVVGKDWWLKRHEYDGSEWWEFKSLPVSKNKKEIISVTNKDYEDNVTFK